MVYKDKNKYSYYDIKMEKNIIVFEYNRISYRNNDS